MHDIAQKILYKHLKRSGKITHGADPRFEVANPVNAPYVCMQRGSIHVCLTK